MTPHADLPRGFVRLWLALLVALGAWLRLSGASDFYYSPDEMMHLGVAGADSLGQVLTFARYEVHPPLTYILYHYWLMLSTDPAFVRGLALFFGLLLIPLYYAIGRELNGPWTGMACAALIAFSHGCIIQSYVVRQYAPFLLFCSLSFYGYLRWRAKPQPSRLAVYGICAVLACLTHFSGIFYVFCVATYETLARCKQNDREPLKSWVPANFAIAVPATGVYLFWRPIFVPLRSYFASKLTGSFANIAVHALFYPLATPGYMLPGYTAALIFLFAQVWVALAPPAFIRNRQGLFFLLRLNAFAYLTGMAMILSKLYPEPGTRHSLWVLPFVIAPAGWMLGDLLAWVVKSPLRKASRAAPLTAVALLAGGALTYHGEYRYSEGSEYVWPTKTWNEFDRYMQSLGPKDLIVTEKDDGIMLTSLYPFMGDGALSGKSMTAIAPYRSTHILFNPHYPRNYSTAVFLATLEEAARKHLFDDIDRLVFLRMAWSRSPLTDLMLCDKLDKEIVTFPSYSRLLTRTGIYGHQAALLILPKTVFLRDVLNPAGEARPCLDAEHDTASGSRLLRLESPR